MPNTIRHKRNATASAAPAAASLVAGELAVNTADGRVYTKRDSGTVVDIAQAILGTGQSFVAAAGSATGPSISFTGDSNTGTYSPGADQWAVTTGGVQRIAVSDAGDVGVGIAASAGVRLHCYQTITNTASSVTHQVFTDPISTATGTYTTFGAYYVLRTDVAAGVSDAGAKRGVYVSAARNNKQASGTDAGTLTFLRGAEISYGHSVNNTALTPTTTQVVGLYLGPMNGYGTVADMYDLYIAADTYSFGSIGNHYAIYQAGNTSRNYFSGNVGIGASRTNPASALDVNGVITSALGSVAAPALTFTGDTNTGIYSPGADQLNIVTGGVARITVSAAGLVATAGDLSCLGTFRSSVGLQASGGRSLFRAVNEPYAVGSAYSATSGAVYFGAANESATPDAQISNAGGSALIYLQNGGNVGIGTTAPAFALDVSGSGATAAAVRSTGGSSASVNLYSSTNTSQWSMLGTTLYGTNYASAGMIAITQTGAGMISFAVNGASRLFVADYGLRVVDTGSAAAPVISKSDDTNTGMLFPAADTIAWATGGTERIRVASDGAVSIAGEFKPTHYTESVVAIGNSGTTQTLALTSGTVQTCTLTGNCTFTMPTATAGKSFVLLLKTGTGSFTATFTGVKWPGNVAPTITATAAKLEVISFIADGTNWYGNISQNYTP